MIYTFLQLSRRRQHLDCFKYFFTRPIYVYGTVFHHVKTIKKIAVFFFNVSFNMHTTRDISVMVSVLDVDDTFIYAPTSTELPAWRNNVSVYTRWRERDTPVVLHGIVAELVENGESGEADFEGNQLTRVAEYIRVGRQCVRH